MNFCARLFSTSVMIVVALSLRAAAQGPAGVLENHPDLLEAWWGAVQRRSPQALLWATATADPKAADYISMNSFLKNGIDHRMRVSFVGNESYTFTYYRQYQSVWYLEFGAHGMCCACWSAQEKGYHKLSFTRHGACMILNSHDVPLGRYPISDKSKEKKFISCLDKCDVYQVLGDDYKLRLDFVDSNDAMDLYVQMLVMQPSPAGHKQEVQALSAAFYISSLGRPLKDIRHCVMPDVNGCELLKRTPFVDTVADLEQRSAALKKDMQDGALSRFNPDGVLMTYCMKVHAGVKAWIAHRPEVVRDNVLIFFQKYAKNCLMGRKYCIDVLEQGESLFLAVNHDMGYKDIVLRYVLEDGESFFPKVDTKLRDDLLRFRIFLNKKNYQKALNMTLSRGVITCTYLRDGEPVPFVAGAKKCDLVFNQKELEHIRGYVQGTGTTAMIMNRTGVPCASILDDQSCQVVLPNQNSQLVSTQLLLMLKNKMLTLRGMVFDHSYAPVNIDIWCASCLYETGRRDAPVINEMRESVKCTLGKHTLRVIFGPPRDIVAFELCDECSKVGSGLMILRLGKLRSSIMWKDCSGTYNWRIFFPELDLDCASEMRVVFSPNSKIIEWDRDELLSETQKMLDIICPQRAKSAGVYVCFSVLPNRQSLFHISCAGVDKKIKIPVMRKPTRYALVPDKRQLQIIFYSDGLVMHTMHLDVSPHGDSLPVVDQIYRLWVYSQGERVLSINPKIIG